MYEVCSYSRKCFCRIERGWMSFDILFFLLTIMLSA
nr:MAG TPA: hypothetical protein [Caudoviricetes sp.]